MENCRCIEHDLSLFFFPHPSPKTSVTDAVRADSKRKAVANDLVLSMLRGPQGSNIKITTKGRDQRTRQV